MASPGPSQHLAHPDGLTDGLGELEAGDAGLGGRAVFGAVADSDALLVFEGLLISKGVISARQTREAPKLLRVIEPRKVFVHRPARVANVPDTWVGWNTQKVGKVEVGSSEVDQNLATDFGTDSVWMLWTGIFVIWIASIRT
jgi:hypothetical protein